MSVITVILIFGGAAVFLLLLVGMVITMTSERSLVEQRLGRYIQEEAAEIKKGQRTSLVGDWLNVRLEKSSWGEGIARELARADLKLKTGEYLAIIIIVGALVGFIVWYMM